jgi:hypothetical protein
LEFAVETYAPPQATSSPAAPVAKLARAAEQVSEPGAAVELRGAVFLPAGETDLYLYQAASPDAVRAAVARRAPALPADRPSHLDQHLQTRARAPAVNRPTHPREVRGQR